MRKHVQVYVTDIDALPCDARPSIRWVTYIYGCNNRYWHNTVWLTSVHTLSGIRCMSMYVPKAIFQTVDIKFQQDRCSSCLWVNTSTWIGSTFWRRWRCHLQICLSHLLLHQTIYLESWRHILPSEPHHTTKISAIKYCFWARACVLACVCDTAFNKMPWRPRTSNFSPRHLQCGEMRVKLTHGYIYNAQTNIIMSP